MGRLVAARGWLETAFKLGDEKQLKLKALEERELEQLWRGDWGSGPA
jgi:hypothetical protein